MDKIEDKAKKKKKGPDFSWLPERMPGVARMVKEKRALYGNWWVNECWTRGVVCLEPGWFYAAEGALAIGVLWDDPEIFAFATQRLSATQALVIMREPGTKEPGPIETLTPGVA